MADPDGGATDRMTTERHLEAPKDRAIGPLCAIHQPNFFPWLGYFDKIRRADVFVFLDDVAYPRSGSGGMGSWTNRVRIAIQGEARWVGCPVRRYSGVGRIRDIRIDDRQPWRRKVLRTLETSYRRSANYASAVALLEPLVSNPSDSLSEYNILAVCRIAQALGMSCRFVRQSELGVKGRATELLIEITRAVGCGAYLCGGGAVYQDDAAFPAHGLRLVYQGFSPLPYGERTPFLPGLSVIDYLMHGPTDAVNRRVS